MNVKLSLKMSEEDTEEYKASSKAIDANTRRKYGLKSVCIIFNVKCL